VIYDLFNFYIVGYITIFIDASFEVASSCISSGSSGDEDEGAVFGVFEGSLGVFTEVALADVTIYDRHYPI